MTSQSASSVSMTSYQSPPTMRLALRRDDQASTCSAVLAREPLGEQALLERPRDHALALERLGALGLRAPGRRDVAEVDDRTPELPRIAGDLVEAHAGTVRSPSAISVVARAIAPPAPGRRRRERPARSAGSRPKSVANATFTRASTPSASTTATASAIASNVVRHWRAASRTSASARRARSSARTVAASTGASTGCVR